MAFAGIAAGGSAGSATSVSCGGKELVWAGSIGLVEQDLEQYSCRARCICVSSPAGEAFCAVGGLDDLGIEVGLGSDEPGGFGGLMAVRRSARSAEGCLELPETEVEGEAFESSWLSRRLPLIVIA